MVAGPAPAATSTGTRPAHECEPARLLAAYAESGARRMTTRCSRVLGYPAPATCGPWADRARKPALQPGSNATRLTREPIEEESENDPNQEVVAARRARRGGDRLHGLRRLGQPEPEHRVERSEHGAA